VAEKPKILELQTESLSDFRGKTNFVSDFAKIVMMMIAFITFKSSLVPLLEGL